MPRTRAEPVKQLFIDTNVLLSFLHFTSDDLQELKKLANLVTRGALTLLLPEQVRNEYLRNRESKLADMLQLFRRREIVKFPQVSRQYPQYEKLRKLQVDLERTHSELLDELIRDIASRSLKADEVVEELFQVATVLPISSAIAAKARLRVDLGNPPGKGGSLGDAINWETLLEHSAPIETFYFVTADADFLSPLDKSRFNQFLRDEWGDVNGAPLRHYDRLSAFLDENFPDIHLADEEAKDRLLKEFAESNSFAETHRVVSKLSRHSDLTPIQAAQVLDTFSKNNQVGWVAFDYDVASFATKLLEQHRAELPPDLVQIYSGHFYGNPDSPFFKPDWTPKAK